MISIICASNNEKMLKEMLLKSLEYQTCSDYEVIIVDAKAHGFQSASETLNYGASVAKGDLLMFVHQDIELLDRNFLTKLSKYAETYDFAIAGVCGVVDNGEYIVYSSVTMGNNHIQAGIKNERVREIYALDECLFVIKASEFKRFCDLGKTWHFYAVDYCIASHMDNKKVLLLPLDIYHLSPGWSLDYSYFNTLLTISKKYPSISKIKTCMGVFGNNQTLPIYCIYRKFKLWIKKTIKYDIK